MMHNAKLSKSDRLQRVFNLLLDGKTHTTRDIIRKASVCAVNSIVAELRVNGVNISCKREGSVWRYWLM